MQKKETFASQIPFLAHWQRKSDGKLKKQTRTTKTYWRDQFRFTQSFVISWLWRNSIYTSITFGGVFSHIMLLPSLCVKSDCSNRQINCLLSNPYYVVFYIIKYCLHSIKKRASDSWEHPLYVFLTIFLTQGNQITQANN